MKKKHYSEEQIAFTLRQAEARSQTWVRTVAQRGKQRFLES